MALFVAEKAEGGMKGTQKDFTEDLVKGFAHEGVLELTLQKIRLG